MKQPLGLFVSFLLAPITSTASGINDDAVSLRGLQSANRLWDISEPIMGYSGMQLDLDYTVRDHVRSDYVSVQIFENENCERFEIYSTNNYITNDIINDLSPFGDGTGTRTVRSIICLYLLAIF
jgi:hypothetical protein